MTVIRMRNGGYIEWCNDNELRAYPIAEGASLVDDRGHRLPDDILVDLCIIAPPEYENIYCSAIRVTPALVSIAFADAAAEQPLMHATISLADYTPYTAVPLSPLVNDVTGWIVLGAHRIVTPEQYIFSGAEQTLVERRAVRAVEPVPVKRFRKLGGDPLNEIQKLATIAGGPGLTVHKEGTDTIVLELDPSIAQRFLGPCDRYADDGGCGVLPIREIGGVGADDYGVITIRFVPHDWSGV